MFLEVPVDVHVEDMELIRSRHTASLALAYSALTFLAARATPPSRRAKRSSSR